MSPTAMADLESELEAIVGLDFWEPSFAQADSEEIFVEKREVVAIKSDFATMGGSRPRTALPN